MSRQDYAKRFSAAFSGQHIRDDVSLSPVPKKNALPSSTGDPKPHPVKEVLGKLQTHKESKAPTCLCFFGISLGCVLQDVVSRRAGGLQHFCCLPFRSDPRERDRDSRGYRDHRDRPHRDDGHHHDDRRERRDAREDAQGLI